MSTTIDRRRLPLNSLRAFEAAARHMSFTRAAEALGVTQSAVSRHVLNLEEVVGVALFDRRGSMLALTDSGQYLLSHVTPSFDRLIKALDGIQGQDRGGMLRIALPPSFAFRWASPIIEACRSEGNIRVEIETPYEMVDLDHTNHDVAVVFSRPKATSEVMDLLWMEELTLICRPDQVEGMGEPDLNEMLKRHAVVHVRNAGGRHSAWRHFLREMGMDININDGLVFDTAHLALEFVMREGGLIVADRHLAHDDIEAGRLVAPFEGTSESGFGYFMLFRPEDMQREAVQFFRRRMVERFANATRQSA
ncbi:LysR family transcriptional regulator [Rhizobiales bacterium]|uniref:LysR substrate-binding domain-containing protein n=1 Tax=Hongsoonwoonella zoysiae TaxID=2821844 RepID=UPI0015610FBF|nr:LysR substrate-binding domain-containing protein [Hongsoonwoonella zoysiae]NRG18568.1 LysR family transcriptional regulator [Hongsoonwoonella zoysiae]